MLRIEHGDILELDVDAIVVPQVPQEGLLSELTKRIYNAAGYQNMMVAYNLAKAEAKAERDKEIKRLYHHGIPPSPYEVSPLIVVTPGFNLKAKHAVHVCIEAESWWRGQSESERSEKGLILYRCYEYSLEYAYKALDAESVVFPLLGTLLLGFPEEFSRTTAESAITNWFKKHKDPNPIETEMFNEFQHRKYGTVFKKPAAKTTVYLNIPFTKTEAKTSAVSENIAAPTSHKTPELVEVDSECAEEIAEFEEKYDNARKRKSESKLREYNNKKCIEYLERIPNAAELANILGIHPSNITRYKNYFWGSKNKSKPSPKMIVALSILIGLNGYERYEFFRCALGKYPYDYDIYNQTEMIIRKGIKSFNRINKELREINPEFDLTKNKNEPGKKTSAGKTK